MPLKAVTKLINMFLSLATFIAVAGNALLAQEEPAWVIGKAVLSFGVCWIILGWLASIIVLVVQAEESALETKAGNDEQDAKDSNGKG